MKKEAHKEIFVLRDGHPSTHNHEIGLEAEKRDALAFFTVEASARRTKT